MDHSFWKIKQSFSHSHSSLSTVATSNEKRSTAHWTRYISFPHLHSDFKIQRVQRQSDIYRLWKLRRKCGKDLYLSGKACQRPRTEQINKASTDFIVVIPRGPQKSPHALFSSTRIKSGVARGKPIQPRWDWNENNSPYLYPFRIFPRFPHLNRRLSPCHIGALACPTDMT